MCTMHAMPDASTPTEPPPISEHLEAIVSGRLRQALLLTVAILVVELVGALWSHSLALFSDAGHVTTDIFALGLAWFAVRQTERPADEVRSYGYHRAGILAAMANGATLIVLVFVIAWEAAQRFVHPEPVQGGIVILSALVGVCVNTYVALSFRPEHQSGDSARRRRPGGLDRRHLGRHRHRFYWVAVRRPARLRADRGVDWLECLE